MFITDRLKKYSADQKRKKFIETVRKLQDLPVSKKFTGETVRCKHGGPLGDLIYSIPAMIALAEGKKIHLFLDVGAESLYTIEGQHYAGGKNFTAKAAEMIKVLILSQQEFSGCDIYEKQEIDYDMDLFRRFPFDFRMGHIARWQFLVYGVTADLGKAWLKVEPDPAYSEEIILARSFRYRTPLLDYRFIGRFENLTFVGTVEEFEDMRSVIPHIKYKPVKDFLELAQIIAGCRFFVGNQSFPFSLAEALKVKRALEVSYYCPNVIVEGKNGFDFCFQQQMEKVVETLEKS